jgi:hypothetical protein
MSKQMKINYPSVPNTVTAKEKVYGIEFMVLSSFFWAWHFVMVCIAL